MPCVHVQHPHPPTHQTHVGSENDRRMCCSECVLVVFPAAERNKRTYHTHTILGGTLVKYGEPCPLPMGKPSLQLRLCTAKSLTSTPLSHRDGTVALSSPNDASSVSLNVHKDTATAYPRLWAGTPSAVNSFCDILVESSNIGCSSSRAETVLLFRSPFPWMRSREK